jgi:hypothetical protein
MRIREEEIILMLPSIQEKLRHIPIALISHFC